MSLTGLGRLCSLGSADGLGGGGGEGTALPSLATSASDVESFIPGVLLRIVARLWSRADHGVVISDGNGGLSMKKLWISTAGLKLC